MLKRLAILAVLVISAVRLLPGQQTPTGTPKQGIAKQEGAGKGQVQPQAQGDNKAAPKPMASGPQPTTPSCDESCQQGRQNLQIQNRLALFTGGLVVAGFFQLVLIGVQAFFLWQTRSDVHTQAEWMKAQTGHMKRQVAVAEKQAKMLRFQTKVFMFQAKTMMRQTKILGDSVAAAKASAQAATDQIQMMKDKERARIAVDIRPIDTLEFTVGNNHVPIRFNNFGFTPALKVMATGDARATIFQDTPLIKGSTPSMRNMRYLKEPLFEPPALYFESLEIPNVLLPGAPSDKTWAAFVFPDEWYDEILMRPRILIEVAGIVEYEDIFGDSHHTNFSYRMSINAFGKISPEGSAPIRPFSPFANWRETSDGNEAT
ncbi:MAG TPA: hypothetical protein VGJ21_10010 [Terracidiphilus sp.]|jgi:hypothetical protein